MSGKTKIIVLRTKEIIYTVLFAVIGIVLVSLFIFGFTKKSGEKENKNAYIPGVYHASLELGENTMEIEVIVNSNEIHSITMKNTSETVATMYPLMEPALEQISAQIYETDEMPSIVIQCSDPALPTDERNLVYRAAQLYMQAANIPTYKLEIQIEKRIPVFVFVKIIVKGE